MNPPKPYRRSLPSQRATLAGESTPTKRKTAPSTPAEESQKHSERKNRRDATEPLGSAASNAALQRQAAPEANRISATRFDCVRR